MRDVNWTALFLWISGVGLASGSGIRVSEVVADNEALLDGDGDSPDWVEVENTGGTAIDLEGYRIAVQDPVSSQWTFPAVTLGAGERVVVFASGKDRAEPGGELHTDFRLSSMGGKVWVSPAGQSLGGGQVAAIHWPRLREDEAFGRDPNGAEAFFAVPTPGATNGPGEVAGPRFTNYQVPPQPTGEGPVVVKVQMIKRDEEIASQTLHYSGEDGAEKRTVLTKVSNAGWYDGVIPAEDVVAGELLRWWVTAVDVEGNESRLPAARDAEDSAKTFGVWAKDPSLDGGLRDFQWVMAEPALADTEEGGRGSVYFENRFYDDVRVELHGRAEFEVKSPGGLEKLSHDIEFTRDAGFQQSEAGDAGAGPLARRVQLLSHWPDKTKLRTLLGFEIFEQAGHPSLKVTPVRVQRNGEFYGLFDLVEEPSSEFLERVGLSAEGALYEVQGRIAGADDVVPGVYEKRTRRSEGGERLRELVEAIESGGVQAAYDVLDVPGVVNYLAAITVVDTAGYGEENLLFYHDQEGTGRWSILPWDLDMGFGRIETEEDGVFNDLSDPTRKPFSYEGSNVVLDLFRDDPVLSAMVWRRFQALAADILEPGKLDERMEDLVAEFGGDAVLDFEAWGSWGDGFGMADEVALLDTQYLVPRRDLALGGFAELPAPQPEVPALVFGGFEVSPASGIQDEEWLAVRNEDEVAVDLTGFRLEGGVEFVFPAGAVLPAGAEILVAADLEVFGEREVSPKLGEGRYVVGGYSGHLSNHGEEVRLVTADDLPVASVEVSGPLSDVQRYLVVSEVMYEPNWTGSEFLEFLNTSADVVLELDGVEITDGVEFSFEGGNVPAIGPGERVLVVRDVERFEEVYGSEVMVMVAGEFEDGTALKNSGERIKVEDPLGNTVVNFRYDDRDEPWPQGTGGFGRSLVLIDPRPEAPHDDGLDWSASVVPGGNPGGSDWVAAPEFWRVDDDGDGSTALLEAVLGTSDGEPFDVGRVFELGREVFNDTGNEREHATFTHPLDPRLAGFSIQAFVKTDLQQRFWRGDMVLVRRETREDGRVWLTWQYELPIITDPDAYFQVLVTRLGRNRDDNGGGD